MAIIGTDELEVDVTSFGDETISQDNAEFAGSMAFLADAGIEGTIEAATSAEDYTASILVAGDDKAVREGLVVKAQQTEVREVLRMNIEGKLADPATATALLLDSLDRFTDEGDYTPSQDIIEQNAAKFMIEDGIATDTTRSAVLELSDKAVSFLDQYQDNLAISLKIDQIAAKFEEKLEEQGILTTIGDAAAYVIPFYQPILDARLHGERSTILNSTGLRERFEEFQALSYKQKVVFLNNLQQDLSEDTGLFGENALNAITQFNQAVDLGTREGIVEDLYSLIDLSFVGGLFKGFARTIIGGARVGRNAKVAAAATQDVLEKLGKGEAVAPNDTAAAFGAAMPEALSVEAIKAEPIHGAVMNKILANQAVLDSVNDSFTLSRLTPVEAKKVDDAAVARITRELDLKEVKTVNVSVLEDSQIRRVSVTFGTAKDGLSGYGSAKGAKAGAKRKGIIEGQFEVEEIQGKFYIKVERDGAERNIINAVDRELTADTWFSAIPFVKFIAGAKSLVSADIAGMSEVAARNFQKSSSAVDQVLKNINGLSSKAQEDLQTVLKFGRERRKWLSAAKLDDTYQAMFKRSPTDKEIEGYFAHRQLSDFDWKLRNNEVFTDLAREGYQESIIAQMGITVNGKAITQIASPEVSSVAVLSRNGSSEIFARGEMTSARLTELGTELGDDLITVKFLTPVELPNGQMIDFVVTTKKQASFGPLRAQQLGYEAGGSTIYKGKNFVKQVRIVEGAGGQTFRVNDKTHFSVVSRSEAKQVADDYNEALKAYNLAKANGSARAIAEATDVIQQRTRFSSFDEFGEEIAAGRIEPTPFQVVGDRGVIASEGNHVHVRDDDFERFSDGMKEMLSAGRLWYSKRGERLAHPREGLAPIADPFEALSAGLSNSTKSAAYQDLKIKSIEGWVSKYSTHLVEDDAVVSPIQRFMNSGFKSGGTLSPKELANAETARMTIKRLLHTPTSDQLAARQLQERLANFVDAKGARKLAAKIGDVDFQPVQLAKQISFKARLGMFDPSQFIVQMSMTPGVVAAHPVHGLRALGLLPWIKLSHRSPAMIEKLAPFVKLTSGMDAKTFKLMMTDIRKSGVGLIGGTQGQLDVFSKIGIGARPVTHNVKKFTDHASYFFESAERANQYLAYSIAWMKNGSIALKGDDAIRSVSLLSEALAGNMRNSSSAFWQKGLLSIPTQFQAHPFRVGEIMLGTFGAGTAGGLGKAASARYTAALALTYGAGALPLARYVFDALAENSEDGSVLKEQHIAMTSGILGAMIPDLSIKRIQPFGQDNLIQEMFKGDKTFLELATGPAGDLMADALKPFMGAAQLAQLFFANTEAVKELDPTLGDVKIVAADFIKEIGRNISSVNRGLKSYYAFQYGQYLTKHGEVITDVTPFQSAALALGFPPRDSTVAFEATYDLKQRQENLKEIAKINAKLIRESFRTEDIAVRKDKLRLVYINMAIIDSEGDRREIQKLTMNQVGNLRNISEEAFKRVYEVWGDEKAKRLFNYKGDE